MNSFKVRLSGGLGNQLFQAAFGISKSISWGGKVIFDASSYKKYKTHSLEVTKFPEICNNYQFSFKEKSVFRKFFEKLSVDRNIIEENGLGYQNLDPGDCFGKELVGYWQTERYFISEKEYICSLFQPDVETNLVVDNLYSQLNMVSPQQSVCVHIRRGDYANDQKANSIHGVLPLNYYFNAVNCFKEKQVYVFSDDVEWCELNLPQAWIIIKNQGKSPIETLIFMSRFSNFIIGNSTFSWWGAYLANFKNKKVICPKNWFVGYGYSNPDLIPPDWQIME